MTSHVTRQQYQQQQQAHLHQLQQQQAQQPSIASTTTTGRQCPYNFLVQLGRNIKKYIR